MEDVNRIHAAWMAQVIKEDIEDEYRAGAVPGTIGRRRKPALTESQKRKQKRDHLRYEKKIAAKRLVSA